MSEYSKYYLLNLKVYDTCYGELGGTVCEKKITVRVNSEDSQVLEEIMKTGTEQGLLVVSNVKEV